MKSVFLYMNNIMARTVMFQIEHVLNISISTIILLAENHNICEKYPVKPNIEIIIFDDIIDCINKCDIIITSDDLKNSCETKNKTKEIIVVANPWKDSLYERKNEIQDINYSQKPVIAVLSLGEYTDNYYTEILTNKTLSECGAKIHQIYSYEAKTILDSLSSSRYYNHNLTNETESGCDIIILHIIGGESYKKLTKNIINISPDVLIVCGNYSFNSEKYFEMMKNIANICNIDSIIKSPYFMFEISGYKKCPVYCDGEKPNFCVSSIDNNLEETIKKCIMQKIHFPEDIRIL